MTAVDTETGLEILKALDFDPEIPCCCCEHLGRPSTNASCWFMVKSCRCDPLPYCGPCRDFAASWARGISIRCLICLMDPITFRFEPIKGGH
jgi:hypothetical protein